MNISVFGGTGPTGLLTIQKALDEGYNVTVYARTQSKITFQHDRLQIVEGELSELEKIDSVIKNCDAVISILGPTGRTTDLPVSTGVRNIIDSMEKHSVKRLIATTTPSFKDPKDKSSIALSFSIRILKTFLKDTYQEVVEIGEAVVNSNLDWTLIRIPMLRTKPAKGKLNIGYIGDGKVKLISLTREDLANFLIQQLDDDTYYGVAPVISN